MWVVTSLAHSTHFNSPGVAVNSAAMSFPLSYSLPIKQLLLINIRYHRRSWANRDRFSESFQSRACSTIKASKTNVTKILPLTFTSKKRRKLKLKEIDRQRVATPWSFICKNIGLSATRFSSDTISTIRSTETSSIMCRLVEASVKRRAEECKSTTRIISQANTIFLRKKTEWRKVWLWTLISARFSKRSSILLLICLPKSWRIGTFWLTSTKCSQTS